MPTPQPPEDQPLSIGLAPRHWTLILTLLNEWIATQVPRIIEDLRRKGVDPDNVPEPYGALTAGALIAQGVIVKELTEKGVMTDEANKRLGIDSLFAKLKESEAKAKKPN